MADSKTRAAGLAIKNESRRTNLLSKSSSTGVLKAKKGIQISKIPNVFVRMSEDDENFYVKGFDAVREKNRA